MTSFEVPEPILNSPYLEPLEHWWIEEGKKAERRAGRRPAGYFFRDPRAPSQDEEHGARGDWVALEQANLIRERVRTWRDQGNPGVTRTTLELLRYWRRDGRQFRLFFAQLEAVETIIFLTEARADFLQGIQIPLDEPSKDQQANGIKAFIRRACKMATGTGKTVVMGMVAAWSILNKTNDRSDARFSDVVLVVCPNVTIRQRLEELKPDLAEGSIYRKMDLVPPDLMADLMRGRVLVKNWHAFEPQGVQEGGVSAKVVKKGVPVRMREVIHIGSKSRTARGYRYLTKEDFERQVSAGMLTVLGEKKDRQGHLKNAKVESVRYVESDTTLLNRVLGREIGNKRNILVFNDEAHHAYRIRKPEPERSEEESLGDDEALEDFLKEATVWVNGLDRVHKHRGINFCLDLSATPYFLARVGQETNKVFPWVVSDFGLTDAIESGLIKIPQLVVRDSSGEELPQYFNLWHWILKQLTPAERGGKRASPKPEAVLKHVHHPVAMLGGLWEELRAKWEEGKEDPRPPVFILVCKNTKIAKAIYEWLAEDQAPSGVPSARIADFLNKDGRVNTIRVDSKVVHETDTEGAKSDENRWMRLALDTVGKTNWPRDRQERPLYPEGFEELANKLKRPLHPPGRDIRCIVSVGMLTEGWDCNTVTHIVGLRPFMSQLLCEQVVGRGLRRTNYDVDKDGHLTEEVAKVFGVPFEVIPFKESKSKPKERPKRNHVFAEPSKTKFEITFPRVEGYRQAIRNRITVDWKNVAPLSLNPMKIPPEVEMKAAIPNNKGRPSLTGPGKLESVDLNPYRKDRRLQQLSFELARDLTREYVNLPECDVPAHILFPQMVQIVNRYLREKVRPTSPAEILDVFLAPYYGYVIERLREAIKPDISAGEAPEVPRYETSRRPGSTAEVDFWTGRDVREVLHSHLNYMVADTKKWEQSAAYTLDTHPDVQAFVKNANLGFAIPFIHNGQAHDYIPDFLVRFNDTGNCTLILEIKGFDPLTKVKEQSAERWVAAVNADGQYGFWQFSIAKKPDQVKEVVSRAAKIARKHGKEPETIGG